MLLEIETDVTPINTSSNSQNMVEPKPVRAHTNRPTEDQSQSSQRVSPPAPTLHDKKRYEEEKRRGKQIATACTNPRGGPALYNSFEALGSLGEER